MTILKNKTCKEDEDFYRLLILRQQCWVQTLRFNRLMLALNTFIGQKGPDVHHFSTLFMPAIYWASPPLTAGRGRNHTRTLVFGMLVLRLWLARWYMIVILTQSELHRMWMTGCRHTREFQAVLPEDESHRNKKPRDVDENTWT
jgi:hypothetical protein